MAPFGFAQLALRYFSCRIFLHAVTHALRLHWLICIPNTESTRSGARMTIHNTVAANTRDQLFNFLASMVRFGFALESQNHCKKHILNPLYTGIYRDHRNREKPVSKHKLRIISSSELVTRWSHVFYVTLKLYIVDNKLYTRKQSCRKANYNIPTV